MAAKTIDTVVIGAGHNGLIAAASLAKAGRRVVVLERAERPGGILRGSQPAPGFRAPGLIHTVGRLRPSVVKDLRLDRFGYSTITPAVRMHAPIPDGSSTTFWGDASRTAEELRPRSVRDADAFVGFDHKMRAIASLLAYVQVAIPPDPKSPSLADAIMGLQPLEEGHILLDGRELTAISTGEIRNAGVAFIPEDRQDQGLVLDMSLWENAVLGRQDDEDFSRRGGILLIKRIKQLAVRLLQEFDIRARSIETSARTLSGGNQQKLILARELETDPRLLLAAQPTRGLDVGAIEFVWSEILEQKAAGRAVLLISAELDEIYALSDRIVTLYEGRITGEYPPDAAAEEVGRGMLGDVASAKAG